ncbi:DNA-binding response OmpR family regulator [Haloferula luteola]|uniref:DNA-binding response OmpR family regulator n=1 Tax=Haloferula luteola TaxID=595692 RepID=A0A840V641_9BACT|nr:response regulator [Haloferula luteola]MBB5352496.1 DNA-binding response OmpR family regulator [Haloferula luteola]
MKSTRLLLIDDEPDFTALLKANLEAAGGFEVREVNDSAKAIDEIWSFKPDLCLIDVVMPGMDGGDVVAKIRQDSALATLPILMLTALVEENPDSDDGETLTGGLPFVSKTSDFERILACIEKHLEEAGV